MVESWGTGRPDYSKNVETSVQPVIRSWESDWLSIDTVEDMAPNSGTAGRLITEAMTTTNIYLIYDILLTCTKNALLRLGLKYYNDTLSANTTIFEEYGYQNIHYNFSQGYPITPSTRAGSVAWTGQGASSYNYNDLRMELFNESDETIDLFLQISGIIVSADSYNLERSEP